MKILVVEDERDLNNIIIKYLKKQNFGVDSAFDGVDALDYVQISNYDIIILDIMMPNMNGYEFLKELRNRHNQTPVLMLTAKDELEDKVTTLNIGADDYLVKPFEFEELLARIKAIIRRNLGNISNIITIDDLTIDISKKSVSRQGIDIDLTAKEYEILECLIQNKNRILSREQIRNHVWDFDYEGESNIIDVLIKNIRKKIDISGSKPIIHTKRGLGYVVKENQ